MPGFFVSNIKNEFSLKNRFPERCIEETILCEAFTIKRNTLNKFLDDKIFYKDEERIVITEGVILNKLALIAKYGQKSFLDTLLFISGLNENTFYNEFRGTFSGAIYYKTKDKWIIFTNHFGEKAVFYNYSGGGGGYYIGSQVNYILDALKKENINITLNKKAVYFMLTYACMADDSTYANEIKRLPAGHYIQIENGQISINEYWSLQKNRYNLTGYSDDEIIEQLDQKFRSAIKLEYDKDNEYNYRHITDLSGGLDSRMNTWVAHDMGFTDIVNITYSQSNYLDENIAKKVARYLHNELIFKQLDDVSFIYDIDEMVNMNYGTCLYCGLTGGKRLFDCLNFQAFGVKHTGALGDVILGSYLHNAGDLNKKYLDGQCSGRLNLKVEKKHLDKYADHELYMMNVRGFLGILSSNFVYQNYTEMSSPFLDVDFLEYCFSIPIEKRIKHYIYQKWILKKYPEAAGFKWEAINSKITMNKYLRLFKNFLRNKFRGFLRRANLNSIMSNTSMNPFDYWYAKNENNIRDFILKYYNDKLYVVMDDDIRKDMQELFNKGSTIEKTLVLTALASIKFYFHNRM